MPRKLGSLGASDGTTRDDRDADWNARVGGASGPRRERPQGRPRLAPGVSRESLTARLDPPVRSPTPKPPTTRTRTRASSSARGRRDVRDFKNMPKLERKAERKADDDLAMLDNLVDGDDIDASEWFGGGGRNFTRLVQQQGDVCAASEYPPDSEEARLGRVLALSGVRERKAYRERLVGMGATLASEAAGRGLYRNPDVLGHRLDRLQTVFPGVDVGADDVEIASCDPAAIRRSCRGSCPALGARGRRGRR